MSHNRKPAHDRNRYSRNATKKRMILRLPQHPWRIAAVVGGALCIVVFALILGHHLKRVSDAHRADREAGKWTVNEDVPVFRPVPLPDVRGRSVRPGQTPHKEGVAYGGALIELNTEKTLYFRTPIADRAGLSAALSVSLTDEVNRLHGQGFRVTGLFTVTCLSETDPSVRLWRKGLELALLRDLADTGLDDLLLLGLPSGDDTADRESVGFLTEVRHLLAAMDKPPSVGVALQPDVFCLPERYGNGTLPALPDPETPVSGANTAPAGTSGDRVGQAPPLAGGITPNRFLTAADFLVLDVRDFSAEDLCELWPSMAYAYAHYRLRVLIPAEQETAIREASEHGFTRLFEWEAFSPEPDTFPGTGTQTPTENS